MIYLVCISVYFTPYKKYMNYIKAEKNFDKIFCQWMVDFFFLFQEISIFMFLSKLKY